MLQYEKIDVSEGIHVNKASASKDLCHYWFLRSSKNKVLEKLNNSVTRGRGIL